MIAACAYCISALGVLLGFFSTLAHAQQALDVPSLDGVNLKAWKFDPKPSSNPTLPTASKIPTNSPQPVVIALHGCGGLYATSGARKGLLNARHQAMGEMLAAQGYHVVFPDSLTPRGETSLCVQTIGSRKITQRERRADALGTLAWVRKQPWADPARVALLGWSHGGSAVLAATDAQHAQVKASGAPFITAIAFYPGCSESLKNGYMPNTPLTLLLGADDDWTPSGPCAELAEGLMHSNGARVGPTAPMRPRVAYVSYAGAVHDFDNPLPSVREHKDIPSRLHPGKGVMAGQHPVAREDSWQRVRGVLAEAFKP